VVHFGTQLADRDSASSTRSKRFITIRLWA
jgi:hypothetical protein